MRVRIQFTHKPYTGQCSAALVTLHSQKKSCFRQVGTIPLSESMAEVLLLCGCGAMVVRVDVESCAAALAGLLFCVFARAGCAGSLA